MNTLVVLTAQYLIFAAGLLTLVFWLRLPKESKMSFAIQFIVAGIIAVLLSKRIAHFYFSARPFVRLHAMPLFPHEPDNGFPSDHTTLTLLAALLVLGYSRKIGAVLVVCSLLIGIARIAALVHSPIDILGSVVIAVVSVWTASLAFRYGRQGKAAQ